MSIFGRDFLGFSLGGCELRCDPNGILKCIFTSQVGGLFEKWLVFLCNGIYLIDDYMRTIGFLWNGGIIEQRFVHFVCCRGFNSRARSVQAHTSGVGLYLLHANVVLFI